MSNVYVRNIAVPRIYRNKRIYGGNTFDVTNTYNNSQITPPLHIESGKLTGLLNYSNIINFTSEFQIIPASVGDLKVYRMFQEQGRWLMQDVLFYHESEKSSFQFTIDESEDLNGVIVEYVFI